MQRLTIGQKSRWKAAPCFFYSTNDLNYYFKCNRKPRHDIALKFYTEVHNNWTELNCIHELDLTIIHNQVIWENRYITIQHNPYLWEGWLQKGILRIKDILNDHGTFMDLDALHNKYDLNSNFLQLLHTLFILTFCNYFYSFCIYFLNKLFAHNFYTNLTRTFYINF